MQRIFRMVEQKTDDIILGFPLTGSGTSAAVAHKINRQWIAIEQMDYVETTTCRKIGNKVMRGEQGGISKSVNWDGGGDFIYCELMQYNQSLHRQNSRSAQSSEALVALWQDIAANSFLNWHVNPEMPEDAVNDFIAIDDIEKQRHLLAALLDKNQLYVNLSEIEDADFGVSAEDRVLNRAFYGLATTDI